MAHDQAKVSDFDHLPDSAYIRPKQLIQNVLPWSQATFWRKVASKEFVEPVKLSSRITAFRVGDVRAWLASKHG